MNTSYLKPLLLRSLQAACGLLAFAFGVYLTIQANIGLAPWDALGMAIAGLTGLSYGVVVVSISLLIVLMDLLLGERIGIGTLLDALLVGSSTDLFLQLGLIPEQSDPIVGVLLMVAGLFIMGFGQFVYMKAELCCGPRDILLVAIGKRLHKLPIGYVEILILVVVLAAGWALGGPIGLGTLLSAVGIGLAMHLVFTLLHFEPRSLTHESLIDNFTLLHQ